MSRQLLRELHDALGIAEDYAERCGLPVYPEPDALESTEADMFDRPQRLAPGALAAWHAMRDAARQAGIEIALVSAFRSWQYQHDLIARKLDKGQSLDEILKVNAAPGFSEHHSGCAIDVGIPGSEVLTEAFENTDAFRWLQQNAGRFGFSLSFPRDNQYGIAYEPWHWCFRGLEPDQKDF